MMGCLKIALFRIYIKPIPGALYILEAAFRFEGIEVVFH
jgi:hypothetical protein